MAGSLLTALAWLVVAVELWCLVSRNVTATAHVVILAACAAPYAAAMGVLALAVFVISANWVGLAVAVVVLAALAMPHLAIMFSHPEQPNGRAVVRAMTLNTLHGRGDAESIVALAAEFDLDLLALQELTPGALDRLAVAGIHGVLPHEFIRPGEIDRPRVALFSKQPLSQPGIRPEFRKGVISARVRFPGGCELTVLGIHLEVPWPQPADEWRDECVQLAKIMRGVEGPLIALGDFNSTSSLKVFRQLLRQGGVADAARIAGRAAVRTFPSGRLRLPLLGIDHVLVRGCTVSALDCRRVPGTDHRALIASVVTEH